MNLSGGGDAIADPSIAPPLYAYDQDRCFCSVEQKVFTQSSVQRGVPRDMLLLIHSEDALTSGRIGQLGAHTPHTVHMLT